MKLDKLDDLECKYFIMLLYKKNNFATKIKCIIIYAK